ncbi:hypothetical protein Tco_1095398 [Tanacetum coccineum]
MVEDDHDVIHFDNSSYLTLFTSLNDLDFATLNIDGQSMDVDAPPDFIDVDEDDDFIDDEDVVPHDLANFDDEVLTNDDDDVVMSAAEARGHIGDGGGDDPSRSLLCSIHTGCRGTGGQKPNKGGRRADRLGTRGETKNLELRKLTNEWGPQKIQFRDFLMYYPSWHKIKDEKKARVLGKLMGSRSLAVLRDMQMESSKTREYPSLIQTFFDTHTDGGDLRMTRREFNIGDDMAEGSRRQYADGCALHRGPDNSHGLKGQAAGAHSRGSGEGRDDEPGADEDADRDKNS